MVKKSTGEWNVSTAKHDPIQRDSTPSFVDARRYMENETVGDDDQPPRRSLADLVAHLLLRVAGHTCV